MKRGRHTFSMKFSSLAVLGSALQISTASVNFFNGVAMSKKSSTTLLTKAP